MNENTQFIMLVGLPNSGKSDWAKTQNMTIHSASKLRTEMFGDNFHKWNNGEVFKQLHENMQADLNTGKSIIFNATNLTRADRKTFLDKIRDLKIKKTAIIVTIKISDCIAKNNKQEKPIANKILRNMYARYQKPTLDEGFDEILYFHEGELKS